MYHGVIYMVALATPSVSKRVLVVLGVIADPAGRALTGLHVLVENETKKGHESMLDINSRHNQLTHAVCMLFGSEPFIFPGTLVTRFG